MMGIFDVFKKKALEEEQEFHRVREEKIKEAVQKMQEEELMSSRYEIVVEFMNMILTDKHNKKSEYLINLLFHQKDHAMVCDYNIVRDYYVDKYNLDVSYSIIVRIPDGDMDLLHKIINSVEIDL